MTGRIVSLPRATAVLEDAPALPPASLRGLDSRHQPFNPLRGQFLSPNRAPADPVPCPRG
jgi:hypothetical protein